MKRDQQNATQILENKNKDIPDWFYFLFGMMLVIFSGLQPQSQEGNSNNHFQSQTIAEQEKIESNDGKIVEVTMANVDVIESIAKLN